MSLDIVNQRFSYDNLEKLCVKTSLTSRLSAPSAMGLFNFDDANKDDRLILNKFTLYETKTVHNICY